VSAEDNKAIVRRWIEAYNERDEQAEGDMVAIRVSFEGTHTGEFQGIPPTNKQVAFSEITSPGQPKA